MTLMIASGISAKLSAAEKAAARYNLGFYDALLKKATHILDFANNDLRIYGPAGLTQTLLTSALTFTRTTTRTYRDAYGGIATAGINVPRIDYDPVTGESLGLAAMDNLMNLLLHTVYSGANGETPPTGWNMGATTGVTTTAASPRFAGAVRTTQSGIAQREYYSQAVTLAAATTYTLSAYFAAGTSVTDKVIAVTTSDTPTGALSLNGSDITSSGVYSITFTTSAGGSYNVRVGLGCFSDATGTVIHETPQLRVGTEPGDYVPTTTTAVTASKDIAVLTIPASSEGSIVCACRGIGPVSGQNQSAFRLSDGTENNRILVRRNESTNGTQFAAVTNGIAVANASSGQKTSGLRNVFGFSWKENSFVGYEDGKAVLNDTSGSAPANMTQIYIGSAGASGIEMLNGQVEYLIYWPRSLTAEELQVLTK